MDARANYEPSDGQTAGPVRPDGVTGRPDRWTAAAGLVFTALVVASIFTPEVPSGDSPAEDIAAQLAAEGTGHRLSLLLGLIADIAFLVFLAGLWSRLRRWEGQAGMFAALVLTAGTAVGALMLVSGGLHLVLIQYASGGQSDPAVLPALAVLNQWVGAAILPPSIAMFLGAAVAILTTRALPRWLGWVAAATALLQLIALAGVFQTTIEGVVGIAAFVGFLLFMVWVLATSVVLLIRPGRQPNGP
ncbi:DUF4386 family protein [Arthrobacter sp. CDRTa11]|uniref:DUF4386 family protein n=1 Tax=Arthrobacter sp. CDRTa11 TaxID=2651199 RepID=UPI002265DA59|nr:DUF4386 family protein [Arthrobacter sp. CDRTa11]UZX02184.1 DUF4386 family protein [Arthrobacter sp. CDRTa11]